MLRWHKATIQTFWRFIEDTITTASVHRQAVRQSLDGRGISGEKSNPDRWMNFPMQANGAEMMRMAAIAATEAGIEVCCPVHDAFLISAPTELIDEQRGGTCARSWRRPSRAVTGGLTVRTDVKIVRWPDRYMDKRGKGMWDKVMSLLERMGTPAPGSHEREPNLLTSDTVAPTFS